MLLPGCRVGCRDARALALQQLPEHAGGKRLSATGRKSRPWRSPKTTSPKNILNKIMKAPAEVNAKMQTARKVDTPPWKTLTPTLSIARWMRSGWVPFSLQKASVTWAL